MLARSIQMIKNVTSSTFTLAYRNLKRNRKKELKDNDYNCFCATIATSFCYSHLSYGIMVATLT